MFPVYVLHNLNTGNEKVEVLITFLTMMNTDINKNSNLVLAGYFTSSLSDNNAIQASCKNAWITFSFLTHCKILFQIQKYYLLFSSDHSPVLNSYNEMKNIPNRPGFWKFNSSLLNNKTFNISLKNFI